MRSIPPFMCTKNPYWSTQ